MAQQQQPPSPPGSPSWHPSLASSSSLSSLDDGCQDARSTTCSVRSSLSTTTPRPFIRRVMCLLEVLGGSSPAGRSDVDNGGGREEEESGRRKKKLQAAARIVAGGALTMLTAWALVSYRRRRRRHAITLSAASATAATAPRYSARSALESPLSLLLHHAKKGGVLRVRMNKNTVAYQLAVGNPTNGGDLSNNTSSTSSQWRRSTIPPTNGMAAAVTAALSEGGCTEIATLPESLPERLLPVAIASVPFVYLALAYRMLRNAGGGGEIDTTNVVGDGNGSDGGDGGGQRVVTFLDVAGVDSAKEELYEVVRYLSDPAPYKRLGASPPRGVLLHGSPGVGKTLLARAVAGEARADYFVTCSGSDFVELYVGQGAKRVRGLFRSVRDAARGRHRRQIIRSRFVRWWNAWVGQYFGVDDGIISRLSASSSPKTVIEDRPPTAVIFIDEIDALAKCRDGIGRGVFIGGGNDEREQTLNALLTEMDGFGTPRDGQAAGGDVVVIVIAATNRRSVLDPALLRPGRFDRHVEVPNPDRNGREAILRVHARRIKLDGATSTDTSSSGSLLVLSELADESFTGGMSGADLRNVINEAALLSVRASRHYVGWDQLVEAARRVRHMHDVPYHAN